MNFISYKLMIKNGLTYFAILVFVIILMTACATPCGCWNNIVFL